MTFEELEMARQEAGLSVAKICYVAGIARQTWWRWETGAAKPSRHHYHRVVNAIAQYRNGGPGRDIPQPPTAEMLTTLVQLARRRIERAAEGTPFSVPERDIGLYIVATAYLQPYSVVGATVGLKRSRMSQVVESVHHLLERCPRAQRLIPQIITQLLSGE